MFPSQLHFWKQLKVTCFLIYLFMWLLITVLGLQGTQACLVAVAHRLPRGKWDLRFPTRDRSRIPYVGRQILYQRTTREVPEGYMVRTRTVASTAPTMKLSGGTGDGLRPGSPAAQLAA